MLNTAVIVDDTYLIKAYADLLKHAPEVVNRLVNNAVNKNRDSLLAKLRTEPGSVVYPIRWKSERQRRAYFATKGFGHGIPYQRSHKFSESWKVAVIYVPGEFTSIQVRSDSPVEQYITGRHQQPFHAITGWYQSEDLINQTDKQLTDDVETALIRSFYAVEER